MRIFTVAFLLLITGICFSQSVEVEELIKKDATKVDGNNTQTSVFTYTVNELGTVLALNEQVVKTKSETIDGQFNIEMAQFMQATAIDLTKGQKVLSKKHLMVSCYNNKWFCSSFDPEVANYSNTTEHMEEIMKFSSQMLHPETFEPIDLPIPEGQTLYYYDEPELITMNADRSTFYTYTFKEGEIKLKTQSKTAPSLGQSVLLWQLCKYDVNSKHMTIPSFDGSEDSTRIKWSFEGTPILTFVVASDKIAFTQYEISKKGELSYQLIVYNFRKSKVESKHLFKGVIMVSPIRAENALLVNQGTSLMKLNLTTYDLSDPWNVFTPRRKKDGSPLDMFTTLSPIGSSSIMIAKTNSRIAKIIDVSKEQVLATIYINGSDWVVVSEDGKIDGTAEAVNLLGFHIYDGKGELQKTVPLNVNFENSFTPGLLASLLGGAEIEKLDIEKISSLPELKIIPTSAVETTESAFKFTLDYQGAEEQIAKTRIYCNGKLITTANRGISITEQDHEYSVELVNGLNEVSVIGVTESGLETAPVSISIKYDGKQSLANLYVVCIGIDKYKNSKYDLNYANADASAFNEKITAYGEKIFNQIKMYHLSNSEATSQAVISSLQEVANSAKPEDVFILFYAGHGVVDESTNEFYLALHEVTQMYGRTDLLNQHGISATGIKNISERIPAQKQLIILDACQSGGAIQAFAKRGIAEERAIVQLARSSGAVLLASSGSDQYATEFAELGHGVFTYALLEGIEGKADGGSKDGKITIKELEAYLNDQIPILTYKYKGQVQYPRSWSVGQDFPISVP